MRKPLRCASLKDISYIYGLKVMEAVVYGRLVIDIAPVQCYEQLSG